ncbi:MAG: hypothetical protein AAGD32_13355 [Planctomycetota bacterium]
MLAEATITRAAARNEALGIPLRLDNLPGGQARLRVTIPVLADGTPLPAEALQGYAVAEVPVDLRRAGYVRHTGETAANAPDRLPRALLPWQNVTADTAVMGVLPTVTGTSGWAWLDVIVPPTQPAGIYNGSIDVIDDRGRVVPGSGVPLSIEVLDFNLPDQRNLRVAGPIGWGPLRKVYRDRFETSNPRLLERDNPRSVPALEVLDGLIKLAHEHRLSAYVPDLEPTVKWRPGDPPTVTWTQYQSVVEPWLTGEQFEDRVPLPHWPLPDVTGLARYPVNDRLQYWNVAANFFDAQNWLERSPAVIRQQMPVPAREFVSLSAEAGDLIRAHPRVIVQLPLEAEQIALGPELTPPQESDRLLAVSRGLVSGLPADRWPGEFKRPSGWLATDVPGLVPFVGAGGTQEDVRVWAWLAFSRGATLVDFGETMPDTAANQPADPSRLIWFYPGEWFGLDGPVPSVHMKWLRRAQQDYEYLVLAQERGEVLNARLLANLLAKPVEIQPLQSPDAAYTLMSGTADADAWDEALQLVSEMILLNRPGQPPDRRARTELERRQFLWMVPRERPFIMPRTADWTYINANQVRLRLGTDLYNASDTTPEANELRWTDAPFGWTVQPRPRIVPELGVYQVERFPLAATVDPTQTRPRGRPADHLASVEFVQGFTQAETEVAMRLPAVTIDRLPGGIVLDGELADWLPADQIHAGPLVAMFDRPSVQDYRLIRAPTETSLHAGYTEDNLYVAFRLEGASDAASRAGNVIEIDTGRAWGEDVAQLLIQAVYEDGSVGPLMLLNVKPTGVVWAERRRDPKRFRVPWQPFESNTRFQSTLVDNVWRGELAIPLTALELEGRFDERGNPVRPVMYKFNFAQHRHETGQTATWAGPVDGMRDKGFAGVLVVGNDE